MEFQGDIELKASFFTEATEKLLETKGKNKLG
jgi:hypothetical protein